MFVYQRVTNEFTHLPNPKNAIVYANLLEGTVHNTLTTGRADFHLESWGNMGKKTKKPLVVKHGNGKATIYNTLSER